MATGLCLPIVCSAESGSSRFASWCYHLISLSPGFHISNRYHCSLSHYASMRIACNELLHTTHLAPTLAYNKCAGIGIYKQSNRKTRTDIFSHKSFLSCRGTRQELSDTWWMFPLICDPKSVWQSTMIKFAELLPGDICLHKNIYVCT